jgi:hypothetical protein
MNKETEKTEWRASEMEAFEIDAVTKTGAFPVSGDGITGYGES